MQKKLKEVALQFFAIKGYETTELLSAGMQETAASMQETNATSQEIEIAIESIAQKAQEGACIASQINGKAVRIMNEAVKSQHEAERIYKETQYGLNEAIEEVKAVNKINWGVLFMNDKIGKRVGICTCACKNLQWVYYKY